tara:strand:- start:1677 stop:2291 length:615 start_codon:yes stop_codon:yes gene_type:complete
MFCIEEIKNGDLLKINGENESGASEIWYAEKIGEVKETNELEVFFMTPTKDETKEWEYEEDYSLVPLESVIEHVPNNLGYKIAWKKFGFVKISTTRVIKLEDIDTIEIGDSDSDSDMSSEESELESDLDGFIVPDEEGEAFTLAESNEWVDETHKAVHSYNNWVPKSKEEENAKKYIDELSQSVSEKEDERQFIQGKNINYNNP